MPSVVAHIVLNPKSGGGRAYRRRDYVVRQLADRGVHAEIHLTEAPGHAVTIARKLSDAGADRVVAAGGDGTMHDVANGILQSKGNAAMGVLPLGTGNDFAKVVAGSQIPFETIAGGRPTRFDVGHASWERGNEYFVNGMGTGIDVEVVRQLHRLPNMPGPAKYLAGLLRALVAYKPVELGAIENGTTEEHRVMMMAVGNGVCQGGGFYLTPDSSTNDGKLNLCVVNAIPLWQVPAVLPRVLRGTHESHAAVSARTIEQIRFEARGENSLYFQLDGELREPPGAKWVNVEVKPGALRVLTLK
ncbi:MAG TPA: diacylglycerol kinase family protein [Longimicrobiales bacterium]|nr:diacylglycerol kinase family protein [Longimicrobiales bacterium]